MYRWRACIFGVMSTVGFVKRAGCISVCRLDRWRWQTKMNARLKQLGQPNIPDMQIHPLFFLPPLKTTPPHSHTHTNGVHGKQKHRIWTHLRRAIQNLLHAKAQVIWTVAGISRAVLSAFHLDSLTAVTNRDYGSFCFVLDDCVKTALRDNGNWSNATMQ